MSYKPYPKYKSSGVEWIGEIPERWDSRRLKYSLVIQTEKAGEIQPDDFRMALENVEGWTGNFVETGSVFEGEGVRFAEGDLLFGKLRPYLAKVFEATHSGTAVGEFFVLKPKVDIQSRYMFYRLLTKEAIEVVNSSTYGAKMPRTSWEFMGDLKLPVPPTTEQTKIATFLDRKTAQIDKLIEIKRKQIKLLKEERTAIINQAVTKGLNPPTKMKESGSEWIGEIPAGWEYRKIKQLIQFVSGGTPPTDKLHFWKHEMPWVSSKDMKSEVISDTKVYISESAIVEGKSTLLPAGSGLLVVRSGILQHSIPIAICNREVAFNQDIKGLIPNTELLDINYFTWFVRGNHANLLKEWRKQGATVESLESEFIYNFKLPLPPLDLQKELIDTMKEMSQKVDRTIAKDLEQIQLLQEYRTTLISDAVTGKIDIREEAA